jgi:hypothetical protein
MDFYDYYKSLTDLQRKRILRKTIIEQCRIEPTSFYSWLQRRKVPKLPQTIIAEILQKPLSELFPETEQIEIV